MDDTELYVLILDFTVLSPFRFALILPNVSCEEQSSQDFIVNGWYRTVCIILWTLLSFLLLFLLKFSLMFLQSSQAGVIMNDTEL